MEDPGDLEFEDGKIGQARKQPRNYEELVGGIIALIALVAVVAAGVTIVLNAPVTFPVFFH